MQIKKRKQIHSYLAFSSAKSDAKAKHFYGKSFSASVIKESCVTKYVKKQ